MTGPLNERLAGMAAVLAATAVRARWLILVSAAIAVFAAARFTAGHIGINTDTTDMLSERLAWRAAYTEFTTFFAGIRIYGDK